MAETKAKAEVKEDQPAKEDHALWEAVKTWVAGRQYGASGTVAAALKTWAESKGL